MCWPSSGVYQYYCGRSFHPPATECQHNWISESTLVIQPIQVCTEEALVHYSAPAPPSTAHNSSPKWRQGQTESRKKNPYRLSGTRWHLREPSAGVHFQLEALKMWSSYKNPSSQMESVSIRKVYWFTEIPGFHLLLRLLSSTEMFRLVLELHFYWKGFISIINEVRNLYSLQAGPKHTPSC